MTDEELEKMLEKIMARIDEEKAKEYVNEIPFSNTNFQLFHKDQIKQVYLDGFAEGIKDGYKKGLGVKKIKKADV